LVLFAWIQRPRPELKLVFCSVGQGDAVLMIWQDRQVLVDGGPNNRVLDCLGRHLPFWDRQLELVIASHNEADHITGLIEVVNRYQIDQFIAVNEVNDTAEWLALNQAVNRRGVSIKELTSGAVINFGPIKLTWLWPDKPGNDILAWQEKVDPKVLGVKTSLNDFSQVILASFGEFDWLLTGDIDAKIEQKLVTSGTLPEVELLKVAHHGSKYSSSRSFLEAVSPELAVIEVGKNSYGHPTPATLDRLRQIGAKIKRTDLDGEVVVISNGRNWQVIE
jgi:competence protein ComEC